MKNQRENRFPSQTSAVKEEIIDIFPQFSQPVGQSVSHPSQLAKLLSIHSIGVFHPVRLDDPLKNSDGFPIDQSCGFGIHLIHKIEGVALGGHVNSF